MILVFGKTGQVAQALALDFKNADNFVFVSSQDANFLHPNQVLSILDRIRPKVIINASAHTAVDKAETEQAESMQINGLTVGMIAEWCAKNKASLIHFSTDYVFDGCGENKILENQQTHPVNYYGQTKLKGEELIQKSGCSYLIFRVAWVYAPWGKNFPKTILRLAQEREKLTIVADQIGAPTDAREISAFIKEILNTESETFKISVGIYHLAFKDYISWFELAKLTIQEAKNKGFTLKVKEVLPLTTEQFPTPAKRPKNSRLASQFDFINSRIELVKQRAQKEKWGFLE